MKVAQAISRALVSEGVTLAAGIAGQSVGQLLDAIFWTATTQRTIEGYATAFSQIVDSRVGTTVGR